MHGLFPLVCSSTLPGHDKTARWIQWMSIRSFQQSATTTDTFSRGIFPSMSIFLLQILYLVLLSPTTVLFFALILVLRIRFIGIRFIVAFNIVKFILFI